MPNPRILDFTPQIQDTPLSRTLDAFSQKYLQNKQQDQETDALEQIYAPYRNKEASIEDTFAAIQTNRNLSPSARLNATRDLLNLAQVETARKKAEAEALVKQQKLSKEEVSEEVKAQQQEKLVKAGLPPQLAELWSQASTGGKTALMNYLIKQAEYDPRFKRYVETLTGVEGEQQNLTPEEATPQIQGQESSAMPEGQLPQGQTLDGAPEQTQVMPTRPPVPNAEANLSGDENLPPDKLFTRKEARLKENTPILMKLNENIRAAEGNENDLLQLQELSTQIPDSFFQKINTNPFTGDIFLPAAASDAEVKYSKILNSFIRRAKEYFGSRVTNFDLERFLTTLPNLALNQSGRKAIIKQMQLANELMLLEDRGIRNVFDEKGVRNIDYADAERIARSRTAEQYDRIRKEMLEANKASDEIFDKRVEKAKKRVPEGQVLLLNPQGKFMAFPKKQADDLLKNRKGFRKL